MGNYVADQILHQNADKDTHDNSLKQLEVWGYDTEAFLASYEMIKEIQKKRKKISNRYY